LLVLMLIMLLSEAQDLLVNLVMIWKHKIFWVNLDLAVNLVSRL
jgi:hypothetical protein